MGFFDDLKSNIDGGIKSVQSWGASATETLRNLTPETRQIGKELDIITGKSKDKLYVEKANDLVQKTIVETPQVVSKAWEETTPKVTESLRNLTPETKQIGKELDIITGKSDDKPFIQKVADTITADVPDLSNVPNDVQKAIEKGWEEASEPIWERDSFKKIIGEDTANDIKNNVENIPNVIIQPVKETVNNVTKGVSEALPILAIGAGGLILASLLLGRR